LSRPLRGQKKKETSLFPCHLYYHVSKDSVQAAKQCAGKKGADRSLQPAKINKKRKSNCMKIMGKQTNIQIMSKVMSKQTCTLINHIL